VKIIDVRTYLVRNAWRYRLFVRLDTDEGWEQRDPTPGQVG
jgi:hypothetical protein